MAFNIILIFFIQIILPTIFIIMLWKLKGKNKFEWIIQSLFTLAFISWLFFAGSWDVLGYYLRFIWIILFITAFYFSWKNNRSLRFWIPLNLSKKISLGINILLLLVFAMYNIFAFSGFFTKDEAIELSFPLRDGTYYVGHGGSNPIINYHNAYEDQQYALDIVKLNAFGTRANGIYPKQLNRYAIYGDTLHSPCTGDVLEAENNLANLIPPATNSEQPFGNYVALACEDIDAVIYIAHMQKNSLTVKKGDHLQDGQKIGSVGNSGNTSEPHLHIHAEKNGVGIPIQFDNKFLVRNNLIR